MIKKRERAESALLLGIHAPFLLVFQCFDPLYHFPSIVAIQWLKEKRDCIILLGILAPLF